MGGDMKKTSAYARKLKNKGRVYNGAAWLNTLEACRGYTDQPIIDGMAAANTLGAATKSAIVVREAFDDLRKGTGDRQRAWDIAAHVVNIGTIRAIEIAGDDAAINPMMPIFRDAKDALQRSRDRYDKTGVIALDGPGIVEVGDAIDVYQEILMQSSPKQMADAVRCRIDVLAGKNNSKISHETIVSPN
jgi:hypothetical protein